AVQNRLTRRGGAHHARGLPINKNVQLPPRALASSYCSLAAPGGHLPHTAVDLRVGCNVLLRNRKPCALDRSYPHPGRIREDSLKLLLVPLLERLGLPGLVCGPNESYFKKQCKENCDLLGENSRTEKEIRPRLHCASRWQSRGHLHLRVCKYK